MTENILNIYLIINDNYVTGFKAMSYKQFGSDGEMIKFLKSRVKLDYQSSYSFNAPQDSRGEFMDYKKFSKLEKKGRHFELFENIFSSFDVPEQPLVCVTPVVDGKIFNEA